MEQNSATMQMSWQGTWALCVQPELKSEFFYESKKQTLRFRPAEDGDKPKAQLPGSGVWSGSFQVADETGMVTTKEEKNLNVRLTRGEGSNLNELVLNAEGTNMWGAFRIHGTVTIEDGIGRAKCYKWYTRYKQARARSREKKGRDF